MTPRPYDDSFVDSQLQPMIEKGWTVQEIARWFAHWAYEEGKTAMLSRPDAEKALEELSGLVGASIADDPYGPILHLNFDWGSDPVSDWLPVAYYPNLAAWLKSREGSPGQGNPGEDQS